MTLQGFSEEQIAWAQLSEYSQEGWVYRGHGRSAWTLETTLERLGRALSNRLERNRKLEIELSREFRRRFHHYQAYIPKKEHNLEWLSLMQHHGAPTRLLDATYSIQVAAYFALEKASEDCCIWAVNGKWLNREAAKIYHAGNRGTSWLFQTVDEELEYHFDQMLLRDPPIPAVIAINPFALNERLTIQKGVFLCPGDVSKKFEENLAALPDYQDAKNLKKLILPFEERTQALKDLYYMNISRATLFPGLDGFAQSLKVFHPKMQDLSDDRSEKI